MTAVFEKFTERAIKAVMLAQQEAKALRRPEVGPEHIVMGLIAEEAKKGGYLGSGATIERAREKAAELSSYDASGTGASNGRRGGTSEVPFSRGAKRVFEAALQESQNNGMNYIAPEHIAAAAADLDDVALGAFFEAMSIDSNVLKTEARRRLKGERERESGQSGGLKGSPTGLQRPQKGASPQGQPRQKEQKSPLKDFCVDLTEKARSGNVDPVIGRKDEVERTIQILARRSKNNPILLGEPGVGKTAIAEGLAMRIVSEDVPAFLIGKSVVSLDVGLLMAGAKERGELESRVTGLIAEIKERKDVVLMIQDVRLVS
ncbi:AAA family ATPase [bacterium]|nr:AAA family ATPase [bacterium]